MVCAVRRLCCLTNHQLDLLGVLDADEIPWAGAVREVPILAAVDASENPLFGHRYVETRGIAGIYRDVSHDGVSRERHGHCYCAGISESAKEVISNKET